MSQKPRRVRLTKMTVLTAFDPSHGLPDTLQVMLDTFAAVLRDATPALAVESQFDSAEVDAEEAHQHGKSLENALLLWGDSGRTVAPSPDNGDRDANDDGPLGRTSCDGFVSVADSADNECGVRPTNAEADDRGARRDHVRAQAVKAIICATHPGVPRYVTVVDADQVVEQLERLRDTCVFERVDVVDVDTPEHVYNEACLIDQNLAAEAARFTKAKARFDKAMSKESSRALACAVEAETDRSAGHLWDWAADTCQVCGRHLGHGRRLTHLGLCGPCATAPKH